jgi:hypothetical protein
MSIKYIFLLFYVVLSHFVVFSASLSEVLADTGNNNLYRRIVIKAADQQDKLDKAALEAKELTAQGKFIKAREKILVVYETPQARERRLKLKPRKASVHLCPSAVQPPAAKLSKTVASAVCAHQSPSRHPSEDLNAAILAQIKVFECNPPFHKLAMEAIKGQQTFDGQNEATIVWTTLFRIQEPNFLADAVTEVLKAESLKAQSIIGNIWQDFFVKIKDPKLRSRIRANVMKQELKNMKAVADAWRTLLIGDGSLIGKVTSIPEWELDEMEAQLTPTAMKRYAKSWQQYRCM